MTSILENPEQAELMVVMTVHRLETRLLQARIERLVSVLREHGIEVPGDDPRLGASDGEHLDQCKRVVKAAYDLIGELESLKTMVGSGNELLGGQSWRT